MNATREFINSVDPEEATESVGNVRITANHFEEALEDITPSVDEDVREQYEELEEKFEKAASPEEEETRAPGAFQ